LPSECQCFCCEISSSLSGSFSLSAIQGSPHLTWQHESLRLSIGLLHTGNRCPGRSLANTRMFHILFWWLGNPWKPLTASGQSFFQRPFGAINLRSSMDSWCLLCSQLYWTISSIHWHWQKFPSLFYPRYTGRCDRCVSSRMSSHLPRWVAAEMSYLCWNDIQLGYLDWRLF